MHRPIRKKYRKALLAAAVGALGLSSSAFAVSTWFDATLVPGVGGKEPAGTYAHTLNNAGQMPVRLLTGGVSTLGFYSAGATTELLDGGGLPFTPQNVRNMDEAGNITGRYNGLSMIYMNGPLTNFPTLAAGLNSDIPTALTTQYFGSTPSGKVIMQSPALLYDFPTNTQTAVGGSLAIFDVNGRGEIAGYVNILNNPAGIWIPAADPVRWPGMVAGTNNVGGPSPYPGANNRSISDRGAMTGYAPGQVVGQQGYIRVRENASYYMANILTTGRAINHNSGSLEGGANNGNIAAGQNFFMVGTTIDQTNPGIGIVFHPSFGTTAVDVNDYVDSADLSAIQSTLGWGGIQIINANSINDSLQVAAIVADITQPVATRPTRVVLLTRRQAYGDFNASGTINAADINLLNANIRGTPDPATYDLTGDNVVNASDRLMLVEGLLLTELGDVNLDRRVDIVDLGTIGTNWQTQPLAGAPAWQFGDFDGSGLVDIVDLGIIGTNWQFDNTPPPGAPGPSMSFDQALKLVGLDGVAIPEPACLSLLALAALIRRRR
jgi:hypothetical protein